MNLQSATELKATREKLRLLEERYDAIRRETAEGDRMQELTLQSLRQLINQLKEEIARYEAHAQTPSKNA
jgi:phenylacetate-coenzyme A ligase PaaK-like adenylate-forming protein